MTIAEIIYKHAQELLKLAHQCEDDAAAQKVRHIAHGLLDVAYREDGVTELGGSAAASG